MVHGSIMTMKTSCGSTHFYAFFSYTSMYRDFRVSHPFKMFQTDISRNIHFTSISQKAERTYKLVLEGADFGVLWSKEMEETTRRTRRKPPTLDGRPSPCRMSTPGIELGPQRATSETFTPALSRPFKKMDRPKPICPAPPSASLKLEA